MSFLTHIKCFSALSIKKPLSTSNKKGENTYPKGRALMQMYRVVPRKKRGNSIFRQSAMFHLLFALMLYSIPDARVVLRLLRLWELLFSQKLIGLTKYEYFFSTYFSGEWVSSFKNTGDFVIRALCSDHVISKFRCKQNGRV